MSIGYFCSSTVFLSLNDINFLRLGVGDRRECVKYVIIFSA